MKKLFTLTLLFASIGIAAFSAEAKTEKPININSNPIVSEISAQPGRRRVRQPRVYTRTRYVRSYGRLYRETWQYRSLPNGRVTSRLISRVRVR